MALEEGIVLDTRAGRARVQTQRTSSCEHCAARAGCMTKSGSQEAEVEVLNAVGARTGDRVVIRLATASLVKLTFLLYLFPAIAMLIGAVAGQSAAPALGWDPSTLAAVAGVCSFAAAFVLIRITGNRMAGKEQYIPHIIRIKGRGSAPHSGYSNSCPS